jgi:hypothetical protein
VTDGVLALALVGARARGFHHDMASKLQALMIAVDDLAERNTDARMAPSIDAAALALRDIQNVLGAFRALARGADPRPSSLRELIAAAARTAGVVIAGEIPDTSVRVTPSAAVQVLVLACELADPGATLPVAIARDGGAIEVAMQLGAGQHLDLTHAEALAVMRGALGRDGGDARADGDRVVLRFALAGDPDAQPA